LKTQELNRYRITVEQTNMSANSKYTDRLQANQQGNEIRLR